MKKNAKAKQPVKWEKCHLEFSESELSETHKHKAFMWKGKVFCADCLVMMGTNTQEAQAWSSFIAGQGSKMHDQSY